MVKKVVANYYGHEILVVNTWFAGAKLYIDGQLQGHNKSLFDVKGEKPLLTSTLESEGKLHTVEVFGKAIFTAKIKICVDGEQIGGEVF